MDHGLGAVDALSRTSRRHRVIHPNSTTQRCGRTSKPRAVSDRLMISMVVWNRKRRTNRQEPPVDQISDRVQNLAQIRPGRPLGLLFNFGHPATRRWDPHHKLESRPNLPFNGFSNGL